MNKKIIIGITICVVVLLAILSFMVLKTESSTSPNGEIKLTEDKLITDQEIINKIVRDKISPKGNNLTEMVLDSDDPNIMDEPWKMAYYVCTENEHSGWIYEYTGGGPSPAKLYGPYGWCLI